ncbi:MAG: hypothetical protein J6O55_04010 [Lachnospiraceae bacterium]|nr:hypothetical protein [Lachnospiraceae bacterium]
MTDTGIVRKNHLKEVLGFFAVFLLLLIISSYFTNPSGDAVYDIIHTEMKLNDIEAEKDHSIDVLFAGDSLVFRGISPLQIWEKSGITSYDLSDGAMRLCDQVSLIKESCESQSPKLIVLETHVMVGEASPYKDEFALPTNLIEEIFPIFHYHSFYKRWKLFQPEDQMIRIRKGFDPGFEAEPYTGDLNYMEAEEEPDMIPPLNRRYLSEIIDFTREKGIKLLLLSMPSPLNYDKGIHDAVDAWAKEKGIEFVDLNLLNDKLQIDWTTDTKDGGDHMNFEGSRKVSLFLAEYLEDNYGLEDHRGDKNYANWDDCHEKAGLY